MVDDDLVDERDQEGPLLTSAARPADDPRRSSTRTATDLEPQARSGWVEPAQRLAQRVHRGAEAQPARRDDGRHPARVGPGLEGRGARRSSCSRATRRRTTSSRSSPRCIAARSRSPTPTSIAGRERARRRDQRRATRPTSGSTRAPSRRSSLREIFIAKRRSSSARHDDRRARPSSRTSRRPAGGDKAEVRRGGARSCRPTRPRSPPAAISAGAAPRTRRSATRRVNDAVKTLKPGEMTPVIATDKGAYLILAEDKREGDLSSIRSSTRSPRCREGRVEQGSGEARRDRGARSARNGAAELDELYQPRSRRPARAASTPSSSRSS